MREGAYKLMIHSELPPQYTLFADVVSKLSIPIEAIDVNVSFRNTNELAVAVHNYIREVFPNNSK